MEEMSSGARPHLQAAMVQRGTAGYWRHRVDVIPIPKWQVTHNRAGVLLMLLAEVPLHLTWSKEETILQYPSCCTANGPHEPFHSSFLPLRPHMRPPLHVAASGRL